MSKKEATINSLVGLLILVIAQSIANLWYSVPLQEIEIILFGITYILLAYLLLRFYLTHYTKKTLSSFNIPKFHVPWGWVFIAFILPIFVLGMLYIFLPGELYSNNFSLYKNIQVVLSAIFATGLAGGIVEEMIFRGLIMSSVIECSNVKLGILLPSFLFGCLHLLNGKLSLSSALMLIIGGTLVGIMFSLIAYSTHSVWSSMVVHSMWNFFVIGGIVSFSSMKDSYAISGYLFNTNNLFLTGGEFGIEVSIFAILGYLSVIVYVYFFNKYHNLDKNH